MLVLRRAGQMAGMAEPQIKAQHGKLPVSFQQVGPRRGAANRPGKLLVEIEGGIIQPAGQPETFAFGEALGMVEWRTGAPSDEAPLAAFPQAVSRKQTCFQSPLIEPCMKFSLTRLSDRFRRSVFSPIFKSSLRHFLSWLRPRRLPLFLLRWLSCHHNTVLLLLRIVP